MNSTVSVILIGMMVLIGMIDIRLQPTKSLLTLSRRGRTNQSWIQIMAVGEALSKINHGLIGLLKRSKRTPQLTPKPPPKNQ